MSKPCIIDVVGVLEEIVVESHGNGVADAHGVVRGRCRRQ